MKKIIDEKISVRIPVEVKTYRVEILWSDLMKTEVLPTDVLDDIHWQQEKESGFGSMKMEDELQTYQIPMVTVLRKRPEVLLPPQTLNFPQKL
jgi:hypothetical protein